MVWGCFLRQGPGDLSGKLNAAKYRDILKKRKKTCFRELRNSDWAEGSSPNKTMTLSTQNARVAYGQTL